MRGITLKGVLLGSAPRRRRKTASEQLARGASRFAPRQVERRRLAPIADLYVRHPTPFSPILIKKFTWFAVKVTVVQAVTYIVAGMIAYPLFTRQLFEGSSPLLAPLMRLPNEPELWGHVMKWMLPAQILRGVLIAGALYPFLSSLQSWSFTKRFLGIASLYIVIGQWSSPVAGASTIEGWVILRPEFTTPQVVASVIPEGLIQGLGFGAWLARWLAPRSLLNKPNPYQARAVNR